MNRCELMRCLHAQCVNCKNLFCCRDELWRIKQDESGRCNLFLQREIVANIKWEVITVDEIRIRMLQNVRPDFMFLSKPSTILRVGMEYKAISNQHGAVSGVCENGITLGVKPDEFEFVNAPDWILKIHGKLANKRIMKASSLWQPYAQLCVLGLKRIETRGRNTNHRGELAIHSTKNVPKELRGIEYRGEFWEAFKPYFIEMPPWTIGNSSQKTALPMGAIVGTVIVVNCVPIESLYGSEYDTPTERAFGDWSEGRYGWILENPVCFDIPIPIAGKQGLWNWEREVKK